MAEQELVHPKVFISYSHEPNRPDHADRVVGLSNRLRADGIDCWIDQYEQSPDKGWHQWMIDQVDWANYVLVVCTEVFNTRFNARQENKSGKGVVWEGAIIKADLYESLGQNTKFVPVVFSKEDETHIPVVLQAPTRYNPSTDDGYELLYRRLTSQPEVIAPTLGEIRQLSSKSDTVPSPQTAMPSVKRKQSFAKPWNVPYPRNPFFTGRKQIINDMHAALSSGHSAALAQAIAGLGGVGKTQTAVEYAYRYRDEYSQVLWVRADTESTLRSGFVEIAKLAGLPQANEQDENVAVAGAKRWLSENSNWLLIFDNADDIGLLAGYLPSEGTGRVLITTRAQSTGSIAQRIEIEKMEEDEGILFLLRRAKQIPPDAEADTASAQNKAKAKEICEAMGYLPLALDQAGAFVEEMGSSLSEYLELYEKEGAKLREERGSLGEHPSVTVTFSLAFQKVEQASRSAADLIRVCAFLAPDAIPEEIFTLGASELGDDLAGAAADPVTLLKVVREACRYSLLKRDADNRTLSVHRLVQDVVRDGLSAREHSLWAERTLNALSRTFPVPDYTNWPLCDRLMPHALQIVARQDARSKPTAALLNNAGHYLKDRGLYTDAECLLERSLSIRQELLEPDHPAIAESLNNLGTVYFSQGRYGEDLIVTRRALEIREKALGPLHLDVALSLNNLGVSLSAGNAVEAEQLLRRSLDIREKALGPDHPDVAHSLNSLGGCYADHGRLVEAEPLLRRSLDINVKALGSDHPHVAYDLISLGVLCRRQGKFAEAEPLLKRSLDIRKKALGPDHPDTAISMGRLATLYRRQGRPAKALPLVTRALAISEKSLPADHPDLADALEEYARVVQDMGWPKKAKQALHRAKSIRTKIEEQNQAHEQEPI